MPEETPICDLDVLYDDLQTDIDGLFGTREEEGEEEPVGNECHEVWKQGDPDLLLLPDQWTRDQQHTCRKSLLTGIDVDGFAIQLWDFIQQILDYAGERFFFCTDVTSEASLFLEWRTKDEIRDWCLSKIDNDYTNHMYKRLEWLLDFMKCNSTCNASCQTPRPDSVTVSATCQGSIVNGTYSRFSYSDFYFESQAQLAARCIPLNLPDWADWKKDCNYEYKLLPAPSDHPLAQLIEVMTPTYQQTFEIYGTFGGPGPWYELTSQPGDPYYIECSEGKFTGKTIIVPGAGICTGGTATVTFNEPSP